MKFCSCALLFLCQLCWGNFDVLKASPKLSKYWEHLFHCRHDWMLCLDAEKCPCAMTELFFFFCRETLLERLGRAQRRREEDGRRAEAETGSSVSSAIKADEGIWQVEEAEEMAPAQRLRLDLVKRTTQRGDGTEPTVIHRNSVRACARARVCQREIKWPHKLW